MTEISTLVSELESLSDIDWFDKICSILASDNCPTTLQMTQIIGKENLVFSRENRGSKFLVPFDKRFKTASINPDLSDNELDQSISYLSFGGEDFNLKMVDVTKRFSNYRVQSNTYDGGTQILFHPIQKYSEFSAISFRDEKELEDILDVNLLIFHQVSFHFGDTIIVGRDGYHTSR